MKTILSATILFFSSFTIAQPGTLDSTFGTNGVTLTKFYLGNAFGKAMAIHTDGKIVVVGGIEEYPDYYASMAQYLPDGQPDSSFGINGKVNKGKTFSFNSVAIQPDGKILLIQNNAYYSYQNTATLMRYHKNGTPDNSFGDKGSVTIDFSGYLAIQADGKIIVAGMIESPTGYEIGVARYKQYGKIDSSFGNNGKVITDLGGSAFVQSVAIQTDGKIVVGGSRSTSRLDFLIARYNVNGSADSSFGNNGIRIGEFDYQTVGNSVTIQPDGKIIIAGYTVDHRYSCALARYKKNGRVDTSFGNKGLKLINFGGNSFAHAVAVQPDGKIIVAGYQSNGNSDYFALARCTADGPLDTTFGSDGKVTTDIAWGSSYIEAMAIQPDGEIVVGGYANDVGRIKFAIARYHGDGTGVNAKNNYKIAGESRESNSKSANISLSPNPVKNVLYVQGLKPLTSKTISLIDNSGRVVQKITTSNSNYSFKVHHLPAGIYFIRIDDKKKAFVLKFIKE